VLVIMAPSVAYLHLAMRIAHFSGGVWLNEVPSVVKALIHLWGHSYGSARSKIADDQFKLLCSISNSINLELSGVGSTVCLHCLLQCSIYFTPVMLLCYPI
jgi:hypothetical protein